MSMEWTAASPAPPRGYQIRVPTANINANVGMTTSFTATMPYGVHRVSVRPITPHYPSKVTDKIVVVVGEGKNYSVAYAWILYGILCYAGITPYVTTSSRTTTSVTASWSVTRHSMLVVLPVDYTISLSRVRGDQQILCHEFGLEIPPGELMNGTSAEFNSLEEFSSYIITLNAFVTMEFGARLRYTGTTIFTTLSAG